MIRGFVYILTNDSMPGLIKVGRTTRDVDLRASELWQTGVPTRFDVFAKEATFDCVQLEAFVHAALNKHRVNKSREFFAIGPEMAKEVLVEWLAIQTEILLDETEISLAVSPYEASVHRYEVQRLSRDLNQPVRAIADAIEAMTADELRPALARVLEKREIKND